MDLDRDAALEALVTGELRPEDPSLTSWWEDPDFRTEAEELLGLRDSLERLGGASDAEPDADPPAFVADRDTPGAAALARRLAQSGPPAGEGAPEELAVDATGAPASAAPPIRLLPWQRALALAAAALVVVAGIRWWPTGEPAGPADLGPVLGSRLVIDVPADWSPGDPIAWSAPDEFVGTFDVEVLDAGGQRVGGTAGIETSPWVPSADEASTWPEDGFTLRVTPIDDSGVALGTEAVWVARSTSD